MHLSLNIYIHTYIFAFLLQIESEFRQLHFPRKSYIQTQVCKSICLLLTSYSYLLKEVFKPIF